MGNSNRAGLFLRECLTRRRMQRQIVTFVSESVEVRTTMDEEQVPENAEWLVRRDEVDYGPYATEEVLTAISSKEVHMGTWIAELSHAEFEPLGSWAIFRDHYAECQARWDQEIAEAEARRVERRMRAVRMVRMVTFVVVLVIALGSAGFGGWVAWRRAKAKPTGIESSIVVASAPRLPALRDVPKTSVADLPVIKTRPVSRLAEPISYDTEGVGIEGSGGVQAPVMNFNAGTAEQLPEAKVKSIMRTARKGMVGCARSAAQANPDFMGTKVRFIIRSGGIGSLTVGKEAAGNGAFRQCVKRVIQGISVPRFGGDERSVTIPLKVNR